MIRQRDVFWDVVKGVAIIAVILIHTTSRNSLGGVVWRQFINFPVALFFFMAGYFCRMGDSYGAFVMRKTKRLLIPLAASSFVYGAIELYFVGRTGHTFSVTRFMDSFLSFSFGWGYFVIALFQCMLLAPFLIKNIRARWMRPLSLGFYCVTVLYFYLASTVFAGKWTLSNSVPYIFCTAWLPFFILGLKLQKRRITLLTPGVRPYLALFLLMVSAVASGVFWYETATVQLARSQLRLPCILFSLVLAGLLPNLADRYAIHGRIWQLLSRLGEISFFVYLWHRLILIILRSMLPQCAEWYFAFVIAFFIVIAYLLPRSFRKYIWWLGA